MAFGWNSIGHFFASAAHDLGVGLQFLQAHQAAIDTATSTGVAIVGIIDPALKPVLDVVPRVEKAIVGEVYAVLDKSIAAVGQPLNITIDQALADQLRQVWPDIKKAAESMGIQTVPPAGLA